MIGQGKPYINVYQRGDLFVLEDIEMMTYTLYLTVETFGHLKPKTERTIADKPYYYDTETQMYYLLDPVLVVPSDEHGMNLIEAKVKEHSV